MTVRIYCERSGIIREAFRARGHDAVSIDLEPAEDGSPHHVQGDALEHLKTEPPADLTIAHPECKRLANSGVLRLYKGGKFANGVDWEKWHEMERAALFFRQFFVLCRGPLCVENSVQHGHAIEAHACGKASQIIQPYNFGEDASKATALWLRGLPRLEIKDDCHYCLPRAVCSNPACKTVEQGAEDIVKRVLKDGCIECGAKMRPRWSNQTDSGQNRLGPSPTRSMDRARSYPGIARVMAAQWGDLNKPLSRQRELLEVSP